MRTSRTATGTAHLPRRLRRRPVGRNHQSPRNTNPGTDQGNEPQLYGIQIPTDQESSMAEGKYFPGPRSLFLYLLALRALKESYYQNKTIYSTVHTRTIFHPKSPPVVFLP